MATRVNPTLPLADVEAHNTAKSCYVTLRNKVFDITPFLEDHPGGADLVLEYAGKDVEEIMKEELSHFHSDAAYEFLEEHFIGYCADGPVVDAATESESPSDILPLPPTEAGKAEIRQGGQINGHTPSTHKKVYAATGMSSAEDLSKETDQSADYRAHKFLDLSRPLFPQIWYGGFSKDFYLEQVHRPRHYKGGQSAPLFGNFLEPLSKTPWWVVPSIWLPLVAYGTVLAGRGLPSTLQLVAYWMTGLFLWTILEYGLHRCLFHIDNYLPDNRVGITLHFVLHGIHHYLPMDRLRLVMPPTLFVILATPFWKLVHALSFQNWCAATAVYCGGIFGYVCYDMTHYFLHHKSLPPYYKELKKYHLQHHFADYENGFGVTSRFWDRIFKTELPPPKVLKTK